MRMADDTIQTNRKKNGRSSQQEKIENINRREKEFDFD